MKTKEKESIHRTEVEFMGYAYRVDYTECRPGESLKGTIQGPKKKVRFRWEPKRYPKRPRIDGADYRDPRVIKYVVGILRQTSKDLISDNHPGGNGASMDNVSRLIKKGHYRKACWVTHDGDPHGILRRATIVNPENLSESELRSMQEYVDFINTLVESEGRPIDHDEMRRQFGDK